MALPYILNWLHEFLNGFSDAHKKSPFELAVRNLLNNLAGLNIRAYLSEPTTDETWSTVKVHSGSMLSYP